MIAWPLDNTEYTAEPIGAYNGTRTRGVFSADDCFSVSATGGRVIKMSGGLAWLKASKYWGLAVLETADTTWELDVGSGVMSRYVAVVIQLDKIANLARPLIRYGDYAADNPQIPQPVRDEYYDEIIVAAVLQRAAATDITTADITDTRTDEQYCGIMRDGVTGIPTHMLSEQVTELLAQTQARAKHQLDQMQEEIAAANTGSLFAVNLDYSAILRADAWSDSAPYTQTVQVRGMSVQYDPLAEALLTGTREERDAQKADWYAVTMIDTDTDVIIATCDDERPSGDIKLRMKVLV